MHHPSERLNLGEVKSYFDHILGHFGCIMGFSVSMGLMNFLAKIPNPAAATTNRTCHILVFRKTKAERQLLGVQIEKLGVESAF